MGGQDIHNPTVLLMAGISSIILSFWPLTIQRGRMELLAGLSSWSVALIAQGVAWTLWALLLFNYNLDVPTLIFSGNFLLILSLHMQLRALAKLLGLPFQWRARVVYSLVAIVLLAVSTLVSDNRPAQQVLMSAVSAVVFVEAVVLLARGRAGAGNLTARLLAYAYGIGAVYMLLRGLYLMQYLGHADFAPETSFKIQMSLHLAYFFLAIFLTAGFNSLCIQIYIQRYNESEEQIETNSTLLNFALDSTVDAVWDYDFVAARVIFAKRWEQMLGFIPGEIQGDLQSWESRIHPDDLAAKNEALTRYIKGEVQSYEIAQRIRGKDGEYVWIKDRGIIVSRDASGRPTRMVGTMKNIDAEIRQREALRSAQIKYRTIFETMPVGVIIFDGHLNVLEKNPAFLGQARMDEMDIQPGCYHDRAYVDIEGRPIPEDQLPAVVAVREKRSVRDVILGRKSPQGYRWFHSSVEPMHGLGLYAAILMDVTDVIDAQRSLRRFNHLLEDKVHQRTLELEGVNSELEAFSYSISHDLKAPLTRIEGWANALSEDFRNRLGEKAVSYIAHIRSELRRMEAMIVAAINLAKASSVPFAPDICDISVIAENIVRDLRREYPQNTITADIEPAMMATADPVLIETALRNLLQNAAKFSAKRPTVKIEFGRALGSDGKQEYFVRDEGVGFDMRFADKLFAPFQRMHRESEFAGTGIGLATVKRIIHRHGGNVHARSEPGMGTTIFFTLPQRLETLA